MERSDEVPHAAGVGVHYPNGGHTEEPLHPAKQIAEACILPGLVNTGAWGDQDELESEGAHCRSVQSRMAIPTHFHGNFFTCPPAKKEIVHGR